jgi:uncharacterized Zn-finger protein
MHARDATGRQVSLLNDDYHQQISASAIPQRPSYHLPGTAPVFLPPLLGRSLSSSPNTPELHRSDSYDSQMSSNEPETPLTPIYDYGHVYSAASDARPHYEDYIGGVTTYSTGSKRPHSFSESRSSSYDDEAVSPTGTNPGSERSAKRYPCRYRDTHGCEKTFTTSGHASRHSKIHTAEKAVPCTHPGCSKKFTRADNMKQHLETHYKDKSRSSRPSLSSADRRSSTKSSVSASSRRAAVAAAAAAASIASRTPPLPSPVEGAWDMRSLNVPLMSRPIAGRTPSGLDALAMAIACQEGA